MKFFYLSITIITLSLLISGCGPSPETYEFAKCLSTNGAKMFGAFWCGHCKSQKRMFGDAFSEINYIECSLPDGQGKTAVCEQADIQGFPTWEFADGSRESGELSFQRLSEKTGCPLP